MNKRKVAVFVEGQPELIFVREFLVQWYTYDANMIGFECYNLLSNNLCDTSYTYGSTDSENFYMLVNVGNDASVLSKIRSRMTELVNKGYETIIGLRDMYSTQYIKDAKGRKIDDRISQMHISSSLQIISQIPNGQRILFHFAIMEIEAWFLGMHKYLTSLNANLTPQFILQHNKIDLTTDPEKNIFHPAEELSRIYTLVGKTYDKHISDISSIMSKLSTQDFKELIRSGKCSTFKTFAESLLGTKL